MKRLLFSIFLFGAILFAALPARSQQTMALSIDSLLNATTGYATSSQAIPPADLLTLQLVLTKVSGTVAGTALPQGSIDGTNYVDISTDTLTLANVASNLKIWTFVKTPYKYYRIKITTSGTQLSRPVGKIYTRQPPK